MESRNDVLQQAETWLCLDGYTVTATNDKKSFIDFIALKDNVAKLVEVRKVYWANIGWTFDNKNKLQRNAAKGCLLYYFSGCFYWKQLNIPEPI